MNYYDFGLWVVLCDIIFRNKKMRIGKDENEEYNGVGCILHCCYGNFGGACEDEGRLYGSA